MFCPQCGTETHESLKFCKQCGTNLRRVQNAIGRGGSGLKLEADLELAALDMEREERSHKRKRLPEEKRLEEIKAGVITTSVGFAFMVFLYFLFDAISRIVGPDVAPILRAIPLAGLIPFMVGLGIIFNGLFISKRIVELKGRQETRDERQPSLFVVPNTPPVSRLTEGSQTPASDFSVTEPTTTKLREPVEAKASRDTGK
jgi:hypothetical protein